MFLVAQSNLHSDNNHSVYLTSMVMLIACYLAYFISLHYLESYRTIKYGHFYI